jgi:hypothetical protein
MPGQWTPLTVVESCPVSGHRLGWLLLKTAHAGSCRLANGSQEWSIIVPLTLPLSGELAGLDLHLSGWDNTTPWSIPNRRQEKNKTTISNPPLRYCGQGCRDVGLLLLRLTGPGRGGSTCDSDCLAQLGSVPEAKLPVPPLGWERLADWLPPSTED